MDTILFLIKEIPFYIGNYIHRLTFVFSMYFSLIFYGLFSNKEKITQKTYSDGEKYKGNLTHGFCNLGNSDNPTEVKLHYVTNINNENIQKNKPTVVFLHGIFESWYSWHSQLELLDKQNYPCIAIDFKNHGNSSAHYPGSDIYELDLGKNFDLTHQGIEITGLLDKLGIENVIFVTTDLGSLVCDRLVDKFYCKKVSGWIRCHETVPMYPNDKGLPQKYLFWFNIKFSLYLMHMSNDMILRLFYKATGWKSCDSFSATHLNIDDTEVKHCFENAFCPFKYGPYKGHNSNYTSWAGAYLYAFLNDVYKSAVTNYIAHNNCKFPVLIVTGKFDGSCLIRFVDGSLSLGCKFVNDKFCTKMIEYDGQDGYEFFVGQHPNQTNYEHLKSNKALKANEYFKKSSSSKIIIINDCGHMTHLENTEKFSGILMDFLSEYSFIKQ